MAISFNNILNKINSSDIGRRIASGSFWTFVGTVSSKFFVLLAGIFCARMLGKEAYGELGMVRSTISTFVVVGSMGLGMTASKFISEYKLLNKKRVPYIYTLTNGFSFILGLVVTIILLVSSKFLSVNILNYPEIEKPLSIGAIILFITIMNGAQNGVLSGFEDFKAQAINTFVSSFFECLFLILGCYFYGVIGAIIGYGLSFFILWILNYFSLRKNFIKYDIKYHFKIDKESFAILFSFSLPAMVSSMLVTPVFWVCKAMLSNQYGMSEIGMYEAAEQWRIIILFIPGALNQIILPILSSINADNGRGYNKVLKINILLNASICFSLCLLMILFGTPLLKLYGTEFNNSWPLIILALSTVFSSISSVVGLSIASLNKMWIGCLFNLIWAIMMIGFTYIYLSLGFQSIGLALAVLSAYLLHALFQLLFLKHQIRHE